MGQSAGICVDRSQNADEQWVPAGSPGSPFGKESAGSPSSSRSTTASSAEGEMSQAEKFKAHRRATISRSSKFDLMQKVAGKFEGAGKEHNRSARKAERGMDHGTKKNMWPFRVTKENTGQLSFDPKLLKPLQASHEKIFDDWADVDSHPIEMENNPLYRHVL